MRRRYTRESYLDLIGEIREMLPGVALSTDMIVGFPGETDEDFADTLSLTERVGYHSMFSFKYSPRPNTLADKRMPDDVPEDVKTERIVALQALQRRLQSVLNETMVGSEVEILVDSVSRRRDQEVSGRTSQNVVVNLPGSEDLIGQYVHVHVERAGAHGVWGQARRAGHAD
jgi:tRNA-2-methylthio-N6-dimethylallyladenosine synthase